MRIYENKDATVDQSLLWGFTFTYKATGRKLKPTPFVKHLMGTLHYELKKIGLDSMNDDAVRAAFWDYLIDVMNGPPNGLRQQAEAQMPVADTVAHIRAMAGYRD